MTAGGRYDPVRALEAAQQAKRRARRQAILVHTATAVILIAVAACLMWFWQTWNDRRARVRLAELEAARQAELREQAREEKAEADRQARDAARRQEQKEREAAQAQERREREERRLRAEEIRLTDQRLREESKRQAALHEEEQKERRRYLDYAVANVRLSLDDHLVAEAACEETFDVSVDEPRWEKLIATAAGDPLEFLELFRDATETADFSHVNYPDAPTVDRLIGKLASERFTLVVQLKPGAIGSLRLTLLGASVVDGLALPTGARALKDKQGRVTGWTVPFVYGGDYPVFLMRQATAEKFRRDWRNLAWRIRKDAAKLTPATQETFISTRLANELPGFIHSVRIELAAPPPEPTTQVTAQPTTKEAAVGPSKRELKSKDPKYRLKGASDDIRRFKGPQR